MTYNEINKKIERAAARLKLFEDNKAPSIFIQIEKVNIRKLLLDSVLYIAHNADCKL